MRIREIAARLRQADGTSHVRALAYQSAFVMMSGFVGLIGLSTVLGLEQLRATVQELSASLLPGEAGRLLQETVQRGANGGATATVVGLGAALTSGTLAMAQLLRSAERLHGIQDDGELLRRYGRALLLALTAGVALVLGGLAIGAGRSIATGLGFEGGAATAWEFARWPIGLALVAAAIALIVRVASPGKPSRRDILAGSSAAVILWVAFTALLGVYLSIGSDSQSAYGPLLSVIALLLWAAATSLALHLGLALVAERRSPAPSTAATADREPVIVG
ncbi:MAG TPA: YihY/virulence factor BrkB family protein [Actinomycetota bacterium]|nr:YihY/virulence factor BrkB family protein [Actinomycetota bacterium]